MQGAAWCRWLLAHPSSLSACEPFASAHGSHTAPCTKPAPRGVHSREPYARACVALRCIHSRGTRYRQRRRCRSHRHPPTFDERACGHHPLQASLETHRTCSLSCPMVGCEQLALHPGLRRSLLRSCCSSVSASACAQTSSAMTLSLWYRRTTVPLLTSGTRSATSVSSSVDLMIPK